MKIGVLKGKKLNFLLRASKALNIPCTNPQITKVQLPPCQMPEIKKTIIKLKIHLGIETLLPPSGIYR